jgi:hypothetical protein
MAELRWFSHYNVWYFQIAVSFESSTMRWTLMDHCLMGSLLVALSVSMIVAEAADEPVFRARNHTRTTIYHSPQTPGYTCWTGAWIMPDGDLMVAFTQATGPIDGRPKAPPEVMHQLSWYPKYDMTGLELRNIHLRSSDGGKSWRKVSADSFKSPMNGVTGEAEVAVPDGTVIRGVWGYYLPFNSQLPRTGYLERSSDGTQTWGKPEILLDPKTYSAWPRRLRLLKDGRLIALGGFARVPANSLTRREYNKVFEPLLLVSADGGITWSEPIEILPPEHRVDWGGEEYDVAELPDGDLLCVFRRVNPADSEGREVRWQGILKKNGMTWTPGEVAPAPLQHSGHPELLATREGAILHLATTGVSWTTDEGKSWHKFRIPGTTYYPRSIQSSDGTIHVFGHIGGDNSYGSVDQAIVMDSFRLITEKVLSVDQSRIRFTENLIADQYGYTFGLAAADLDRDGDLDLTNADIRGKTTSTLYWFENNGRGDFQRRVIYSNEPGWFERHAVADINGDGRLDVAIVNNQKGQLVWFANPDQPGNGPWKRHVITMDCPFAYDVALADLDGDGDLDAAASGFVSNLITWYENPGESGGNSDWVRRLIDDEMYEARTIRSADFNQDGKVDLIATAVGRRNLPPDGPDGREHGAQVVWYENTSDLTSASWTKHIIDEQTRAPIHGQPVDFDGDGDPDVLMAHGMRTDADPKIERHGVAWYENTGQNDTAILWKRHHIGPLPYAFEAFASDLDGDGDLDVAATAWSKGDRVVWFENHGDPRGRWSMHIVREDYRAANQVIAADFNGDKLPDIAVTSDDGSRRIQGSLEMRWWRNEGRRLK